MRSQSLAHVPLFETPRTITCWAPLSMRFPKQHYWSGFPLSPPRNLPEPGIKLASRGSPALTGGVFANCTIWEASCKPFMPLLNFPGGPQGKESACQCRRRGFDDPWVKKIRWRRKWQYTPVFSRLGSPMDKGAWHATVHEVAKSQTWLNDQTTVKADKCIIATLQPHQKRENDGHAPALLSLIWNTSGIYNDFHILQFAKENPIAYLNSTVGLSFQS